MKWAIRLPSNGSLPDTARVNVRMASYPLGTDVVISVELRGAAAAQGGLTAALRRGKAHGCGQGPAWIHPSQRNPQPVVPLLFQIWHLVAAGYS